MAVISGLDTTAGTTVAGTTTATTTASTTQSYSLCLAVKTAVAAKLAAVGAVFGGGAVLGFVIVGGATATVGYVSYRAFKAVGNESKAAKS